MVRSDTQAFLVKRQLFSPGLFSVTFRAPDLSRAIAPGQFVMLGLPDRIRPYLRRAYSVADSNPETGDVEFLVKTIGPGTAALETLSPETPVGLLGPLGNGFTVTDLTPEDPVAIVAGGIGAAPFPLLLRALTAAGAAADLYLGGRTERDLAFRNRFESLSPRETIFATDDGSLGEHGFVTEVFARRAEELHYVRLYACGPMPMFAALAPVVAKLKIPSEFSTEAEMGCGFGACLACVIPGVTKPFLVSCQEGPIFSPERIAW